MKKLEKLVNALEKLYQEANENSNNAAAGYDEGFYNGEANAYAEALGLLKELKIV